MQNPFGKLYRYFKREYPVNSGVTFKLTAVGSVIGGATVLAGAPVLVPVCIVGVFLGFGLAGSSVIKERGRSDDNVLYINGYKMIGDVRAISSINMTQKLLDKTLRTMTYLEVLPKALQKKIDRHLEDIQPALSRVRVLKDGVQVFYSEFCFKREYLANDGSMHTQNIPCVPQGWAQMVNVRQVAEGLPAPKATLALPAPVASEFSLIAGKVENIEGRLQAIENPKPIELDKAKLRREL